MVTNTYGADGLRRKREEGANTVLFMWDGQRLLRESMPPYDGTLGLFTAGLGEYGPMVSHWRGAGGTRLLHPDALGTIWNTRTTTAATTDSYTFDAFGVQLAVSGTTNNAHRYIGQQGYQTEPTLGLNYVRARWHRPSTGSWLSADSIPSEPRYQYVGGRPTVATDAGEGRGRLRRRGSPRAQGVRVARGGRPAQSASQPLRTRAFPDFTVGDAAPGGVGRPRLPPGGRRRTRPGGGAPRRTAREASSTGSGELPGGGAEPVPVPWSHAASLATSVVAPRGCSVPAGLPRYDCGAGAAGPPKGPGGRWPRGLWQRPNSRCPNRNMTTTLRDARNAVILRMDPMGHRVSLVYDVLGRLSGRQDPLRQFTTFAYSCNGQALWARFWEVFGWRAAGAAAWAVGAATMAMSCPFVTRPPPATTRSSGPPWLGGIRVAIEDRPKTVGLAPHAPADVAVRVLTGVIPNEVSDLGAGWAVLSQP